MIPYWASPAVTLYQADARALPLPDASVVLTDPPWPGTYPEAEQIFCAAAARWHTAKRVIVVLGSDVSPVMLRHVPLSFQWVCWLEYAVPHYNGRQLYNADLAYIFGVPPRSAEGRHVLPAKTVDSSSNGKSEGLGHPHPRKLGHMEWLVKWYTEAEELIVDPFCGSGTTLVAAQRLGRRSIGVDLNPSYLQLCIKRLSEVPLPMHL